MVHRHHHHESPSLKTDDDATMNQTVFSNVSWESPKKNDGKGGKPIDEFALKLSPDNRDSGTVMTECSSNVFVVLDSPWTEKRHKHKTNQRETFSKSLSMLENELQKSNSNPRLKMPLKCSPTKSDDPRSHPKKRHSMIPLTKGRTSVLTQQDIRRRQSVDNIHDFEIGTVVDSFGDDLDTNPMDVAPSRGRSRKSSVKTTLRNNKTQEAETELTSPIQSKKQIPNNKEKLDWDSPRSGGTIRKTTDESLYEMKLDTPWSHSFKSKSSSPRPWGDSSPTSSSPSRRRMSSKQPDTTMHSRHSAWKEMNGPLSFSMSDIDSSNSSSSAKSVNSESQERLLPKRRHSHRPSLTNGRPMSSSNVMSLVTPRRSQEKKILRRDRSVTPEKSLTRRSSKERLLRMSPKRGSSRKALSETIQELGIPKMASDNCSISLSKPKKHEHCRSKPVHHDEPEIATETSSQEKSSLDDQSINKSHNEKEGPLTSSPSKKSGEKIKRKNSSSRIKPDTKPKDESSCNRTKSKETMNSPLTRRSSEDRHSQRVHQSPKPDQSPVKRRLSLRKCFNSLTSGSSDLIDLVTPRGIPEKKVIQVRNNVRALDIPKLTTSPSMNADHAGHGLLRTPKYACNVENDLNKAFGASCNKLSVEDLSDMTENIQKSPLPSPSLKWKKSNVNASYACVRTEVEQMLASMAAARRQREQQDALNRSFIAPSDSNLNPIARLLVHDLWKDSDKEIEKALVELRLRCSPGEEKEANIAEMYASGGHSAIVGAMRRWYKHADLQVEACNVLHHASSSMSDDFALAATRCGVFATVCLVMKNFPDNEMVQSSACGALYNLTCTSDKGPSRELIDAGCLEYVIHAMKSFPKASILQKRGCLALCSLARWKDFQQPLLDSGAVSVLLGVLSEYSDSTDMNASDIRKRGRWALKRIMTPKNRTKMVQAV
jgi:hypothetical protein